MKGKIIKGIGGLYYVYATNHVLYECKAKGIFRKDSIKPLVGDDVVLETIVEADETAVIAEILPRKNELIRPAVANVDQAMVVFAAADPAPNLNLLDRFLIMMKKQDVDTIVCFNKMDIVKEKEICLLEQAYHSCGYRVVFMSAKNSENIDTIATLLKGKTTVLAGPSGVGKSTLINLLHPEAQMETGKISEKIKRGKHTTRHSELFCLEPDTFLFDTPGFSSLYISPMEKEDLKNYFHEFTQYEEDCRFGDCMHINEPGCAVRNALSNGAISKTRYDNYCCLYEELKQQKKY